MSQTSEKELRESLEKCNVCNVALVQTIKDRMAGGEGVKAICVDMETFQRQLYGEAFYTANALYQRYIHEMGLKKRPASNGSSGGRPPKYQEELEKPSEQDPVRSEKTNRPIKKDLAGYEVREEATETFHEYITEIKRNTELIRVILKWAKDNGEELQDNVVNTAINNAIYALEGVRQ